MKPKSSSLFPTILFTASVLAIAAHAGSLSWDITPGTVGTGNGTITGGAGTWNTTNGNWTADAGVNNVAWVNASNDTAVFGGTAGAVTVGASVTVGGMTFNTTGYTFSGSNITLGAASDFNVAATTATIGNIIDGSTSLTKTGTGNLILTGKSIYSGVTTVNAGTLTLSSTASGVGTVRGVVTVNTGATLVGGVADSLGYSVGSQVTTLNLVGGTFDNAAATAGNQGFSTNVAMTGGLFTSSGGGRFHFNTGFGLSSNAAATRATVSSGLAVYGNTITAAPGTTNDGIDLEISGVMSNGGGTNSITKAGAGTLRLSGANTYTGATNVSAGTLVLGRTGTITSAVTVNNTGVFRSEVAGKTLSALTANNGSTLGLVARTGATTSVTGALTLTNGASITIAPILGTVAGGGTVYDLITAGSVTGTGVPTADFSTYGVSRVAGTMGVVSNKLQLTITTAGANLVWNNAGGGGAATGTWDLNTTANFNNSGSNDVFKAFDAVTFDDTLLSGSAKTINLVGALAPTLVSVNNTTAGGAYTITAATAGAGSLVGLGSLTKTGTGTAILGANLTYALTGDITAGGGTLDLGAKSLSLVNKLTLSGGTLSNGTVNAGSFDLQSGISSAVLAGTGALTKTTAGTVQLTASNTFSGTVTVNAGTLRLNNANSNIDSASTPITVASGATLEFGFTNAAFQKNFIINGTLNSATGLFAQTINNLTLGDGALVSSSDNGLGGYGPYTTPGGATLTYNGTTTAATITAPYFSLSGSTAYIINVADGAAANDLVFSSIIVGANFGTGTAGITKSGAGTLLLSGNSLSDANAYKGVTTVSAGTLKIGSAGALGSTGNGTSVSSGAVLDLNGIALGAEAITLNGTGISSGGALINSSTAASHSGTVSLATNSSIGGSGNITQTGVVSGSGSLTKSGAGTLTLSGANTYNGTTTINAGTLKAGVASVANTSGAIGNNSAVTLANAASATLDITGFNTQIGSLTGGGATGGNITLGAATLTVGWDTTSPPAYAGVISGTGGALTKIGSGTLTLSGANTYTGATTISAGTLKAGVASVANTSGALGNNSAVSLADTVSTTLDITGFDTQLGSLTGGGATGGNVTLGTATLTVGGDNTSPASYAGVISGTGGALLKIGSGTLTLTGANTYTGATTVNGGTLQGTGSAGSALTVNSGATLAPGSGIGTFAATSVSFTSGAAIAFEINSATATADKLAATGAVSLTGTSASFSDLGAASLTGGTQLTLIDYTGGSLTGTFTGLAQGATVTIGSNSFTLSYTDGSKVTLTAAASGYAAYAHSHFNDQTAEKDFDGDGVKNGVEYLLNAPAGFTATPVLDGTHTLTYTNGGNIPSSAYGTRFLFQTSSDLLNWTDVPVGSVINNSGSVSYTLTGSGSRFVRFEVLPF